LRLTGAVWGRYSPCFGELLGGGAGRGTSRKPPLCRPCRPRISATPWSTWSVERLWCMKRGNSMKSYVTFFRVKSKNVINSMICVYLCTKAAVSRKSRSKSPAGAGASTRWASRIAGEPTKKGKRLPGGIGSRRCGALSNTGSPSRPRGAEGDLRRGAGGGAQWPVHVEPGEHPGFPALPFLSWHGAVGQRSPCSPVVCGLFANHEYVFPDGRGHHPL
jgi:hypothetical protein